MVTKQKMRCTAMVWDDDIGSFRQCRTVTQSGRVMCGTHMKPRREELWIPGKGMLTYGLPPRVEIHVKSYPQEIKEHLLGAKARREAEWKQHREYMSNWQSRERERRNREWVEFVKRDFRWPFNVMERICNICEETAHVSMKGKPITSSQKALLFRMLDQRVTTLQDRNAIIRGINSNNRNGYDRWWAYVTNHRLINHELPRWLINNQGGYTS